MARERTLPEIVLLYRINRPAVDNINAMYDARCGTAEDEYRATLATAARIRDEALTTVYALGEV
jgi:hypothetical protein